MYTTFYSFDSKHPHKENICKIKSTLTSKILSFKCYCLLSFWLDLKSFRHLIPNNAFGSEIRFFQSPPSYPTSHFRQTVSGLYSVSTFPFTLRTNINPRMLFLKSSLIKRYYHLLVSNGLVHSKIFVKC